MAELLTHQNCCRHGKRGPGARAGGGKGMLSRVKACCSSRISGIQTDCHQSFSFLTPRVVEESSCLRLVAGVDSHGGNPTRPVLLAG